MWREQSREWYACLHGVPDGGCEALEDTQVVGVICCSCLLWGWLLPFCGEARSTLRRCCVGEVFWAGVGSCAQFPLTWLIALLGDRSIYRALLFGKETGVFLRVTVELSAYCFFPFYTQRGVYRLQKPQSHVCTHLCCLKWSYDHLQQR